MKPTTVVRYWFAGLISMTVCLAVVQAAPPAAVVKAQAAAQKAADARAAAEKALLEKTAAAATATEKADAAQKAAKKAAADKGVRSAKAAAEKAISAAKRAADAATAQKVTAEKNLAPKAIAAAQATAVLSAVEKASVPVKEAAAKAAAEKTAAEKTLAEKTAAAKSTAQKATAEKDEAKKKAAQEVASKAAAEQAAAGQALASKDAAAKAAAATLAAVMAAGNQSAAEKATAEKVAAEKIVADKTAAAQKASTALAAAEKAGAPALAAAEKVAAAQTAADKAAAAAETAVAQKAAAQRTLSQRVVAANTAADKAVAAEFAAKSGPAIAATNAVAKAQSAKAAAEKALRPKAVAAQRADATAKAAASKAAAAKVAADKAAAETTAAEKALAVKAKAAEKTAAAKVAAEEAAAKAADDKKLAQKSATAKAASAKAATEKAAAEKVLAQKVAAAKKTSDSLAAADKADAKAKGAAEKAGAAKEPAEKAVAEKDAALKVAVANAATALAAVRGGLKPLSTDAWDYAKARHLLVRAGFGGTPEEVAKLHAMGLHAAVDYVVDFRRQPATNIAFDGLPPEQPDPLENKFNGQIRNSLRQRRQRAETAQLQRFREWWLKRMVESPRPLQEKLTLFWHGHMATEYDVVRNSYAFYLQNELFRDHATGNFGALLYGIVHDPVMIRYLDNNQNYKGHPNENLAREIMELFSMGEGNYSEEDIMEGARALTGYTYDTNTKQFRFIVSRHDTENKTIFGRTGNWSGDDLVRLILEQPATSKFIAGKLFQFFAYRGANPETIDRLASLFKTHQYDLAPTLKNLFLSEEFYSARSMGTQIKSPVQLVVGMLRDFGTKDVDARALDSAIRNMGQELLEPPDVKGWRRGRAWINANRLFVRYNTTANLVRSITRTDKQRGIDVLAVLEGQGCENAADVVDCLAKTCLAKPLDEKKRKELIDYVGEMPGSSEWEAQRKQINGKLLGLLVLMVSTPEYQFS
ncbi:MAG: DUF1800 domain-containing protein [Pirellulaceae bacterium]|nr:DUF1800 domain-containing protein [Pirellulaceae bacterium]